MPSVHAACLAVAFGVRGVSYAICGACAASAQCIGHAVELIRAGTQDIVLAGGAEELGWEIACQYDAIGALSTRFNDTPERASRTYDGDRDGFVISGGAGVVVVEEREHALARGAPVQAEVIGYGTTTDGVDMVVPSGEGAERSMRLALRGVDAPIDYLNTHGTSTPVGDIRELRAIRNVFGDAAPPLSSTKYRAARRRRARLRYRHRTHFPQPDDRDDEQLRLRRRQRDARDDARMTRAHAIVHRRGGPRRSCGFLPGGLDMHPAPTHRSHHLSLRVPFADVDLGGVVYHANYMRYFDQARMEWYRANGIDLAHMMAEQNIGLIVCCVETDFVSPARHDEPLTIRTTLAELKRVRIVF
ncbi:YbgC/FadM family acyl-CoA thioesterase [Burkholderia ubonensis]|uniref:YbgC/FadM family acyl-CoA thioesterase n=1 Tax=Burkholderia ubonensis TaxID=101571 RepID=UPI002FC2CE71